MSSSEDTFRDLRELIEKALDGSISPEEQVRLDSCIVNSLEQRQYYCEYLYMTIGLMRLHDYVPVTGVRKYDRLYFDSLWNALILEEESAPEVITEETEEMVEADQETDTQKVNKFSLGMAAACLAVLLFILTSAHIYQLFIPKEIATLSTSLDATLFTNNQTVIPGARLTNQKNPLFLQTGLIEIMFDGGAKVLLEAPATFRLKSASRMVLRTGQLFALVPESARGFIVETPNSRIIDMGTEFGIQVKQDGTSDLHMFKGSAALTSDSGSRAKKTLTLKAGQAKRVDTSGQARDIPIKEQAFVRHFYSDTGFVWRGQRLCLADLVGKGNGLGSGQTNVYLDPIEGYKESLYCNGSGKGNEYRALVANPYIDGLFIPDGSKRQIISSQAHEFAGCPKTNGECYTTLGANPDQGVWATSMRNGIVQFNGQQYGAKSHPCIVMHANLGITFDLNAIRAICPGIEMARFVSKIGIADFKEQTGCNADFWVLIDGQVRESKRNFTRKDVLRDISIELSPSDRFLTLVTTDGGDIDRIGAYQRSFTCDWCVFVEPALIIETGEGIVDMRTK